MSNPHNLNEVWVGADGKFYTITKMTLGHLVNTVSMLEKAQQKQYNAKRELHLNALRSELSRRKFKKAVRGLFE